MQALLTNSFTAELVTPNDGTQTITFVPKASYAEYADTDVNPYDANFADTSWFNRNGLRYETIVPSGWLGNDFDRKIKIPISIGIQNCTFFEIAFCPHSNIELAAGKTALEVADRQYSVVKVNGVEQTQTAILSTGDTYCGKWRVGGAFGSDGVTGVRPTYTGSSASVFLREVNCVFWYGNLAQGGISLTVYIPALVVNEEAIVSREEPPLPDDPGSWGDDSTTAGGHGDFTYSSDDRGSDDGTSITAIFADNHRVDHVNDIINGGGFNVYQIQPQKIEDVIGVLYGSSYFSRFANYMYNPLSAILSYHLIPSRFTVAQKSGGSDVTRDLTAGGFNITNEMQTPQQFVILESLVAEHIGSFDFSHYFDAFPDFAPYTVIKLYLPYIGHIDIDPNVVMYGTLAVDYVCDVISGNVCAWVYVEDADGHSNFLYSGTGNCAYSVPLFSQSSNGSAVGKLISGTVGLAAGIASGNAAGLIGGGMSLASGIAAIGEKSTHSTGTFAGNVSILQDTVCYLHISRPKWCNPADYRQLHGIPLAVSGTIVSLDLSGRIMCDKIETDGITATDPEIREIERLLTSGVYYIPEE